MSTTFIYINKIWLKLDNHIYVLDMKENVKHMKCEIFTIIYNYLRKNY